MKKFEMTIAGETLKWEEKSHAQIFRNFWNHYIEKDVDKMKEIIELTNIRTSELEFFIARNGSKKRNIPVSDNYWIYTHLTPDAMNKAYEKFKSGMEGTYVKPEKKNKTVKTPKADDLTAVPETDDDLAPEITNELMVIPPTDDATDAPQHTCLTLEEFDLIGKNEISMEEYGVWYEDLKQTQKMTVSKKYKKLQRESQPQEV